MRLQDHEGPPRAALDLWCVAIYRLPLALVMKVLRAVWKPVGEVLFGRCHPRSFYGRPEGGTSSGMASEGETARLRMQGGSFGG